MERNWLIISVILVLSYSAHSQFLFKGHVDTDRWQSDAYLSYVEDYRKIDGIFTEQIIGRAKVDSLGFFQFQGNQLNPKNRIYRIHVDNCQDGSAGVGVHFSGHCQDSREILFIANNTDTINFPTGFDEESLCTVISTNEKTDALVRIDSIINLMKFAYTEYSSETNNELNNRKWFKTLQDFGDSIQDPLANLYIYQFLSDRENITYNHYITDLSNNDYYDRILNNLKSDYPESTYVNQYERELIIDKHYLEDQPEETNYMYWLAGALIISISVNCFLILKNLQNKRRKKEAAFQKLTKQESIIFELLLQDKTNKEIADLQFVSLSTVKTHLNNIYRKLNVQTREEARSLYNN
ncbi:MAG: LuxR C-terminal-related transcriptional regulator [Flavobacteriaceae bacterium]|nr:LuxR C-terminal-related transcriptional regulator [Flavobacteriaceae bacterium]